MQTTIYQSSTRPHQIIHPGVLAHTFLSTSFKVDLKFSGTSAPIRAFSQVPPRSIEVPRQQHREEEDLRLLEINKSVAYIWSMC